MRTSNVFFALSSASIFLLNPPRTQAAYLLNGKPSTVGAYAYEVPPPEKTPFNGDVGKTFVTFDTGALMDAKDDSLGENAGFPSGGDNSYYRTVFIDLGQDVILEALAVRSKLAAWWTVSDFEVTFSTDGKSFSKRAASKGVSCEMPHAEGLAADCRVPVTGIKARFIRVRFDIAPWRHEQIGEIDIEAKTPTGTAPLASKAGMNALEEIYKAQVESPAVDEFGQWTRDDWTGKIHSENELLEHAGKEYARYTKVTRDLQRSDRFGGDKTLGISAKATGKWRLEKLAGRWWFITPEGNPFVMIAVDGMDLKDNTCTNTVEYPGRPNISKNFRWLPSKDGIFADCWWQATKGWWGADREGIWRFDFFRANLIRVFGQESYGKKYADLTSRRLMDWGFNSLGKWNWTGLISDNPSLPYITVNSPLPEPGVQLTAYNGDFTDPWDPNLAKAIVNQVKDFHAKHGQDPYYIGFTIGNEGWWGVEVTKDMLKSVPAGYAKKEFIARLKSAYKSLADLNKTCGTSLASFDELAGLDLNPFADKLKKDISDFIEQSSRHYYSAWREAVDKYDPGRLILGSSFVVWWLSCPEWVSGSIPYCDAMMLDEYPLSPDGIIKNYVEAFAVPADKPVLIGEYSFSTSERGFKAFRCNVESQKERGMRYKSFNEKLYAHPNWVGSMWFIYRDQPPMGRNVDGNGESHNFGLVDICNLPYYDMIEVMKETNAKLFDIHAGKLVQK